jgi:hypothetical protein
MWCKFSSAAILHNEECLGDQRTVAGDGLGMAEKCLHGQPQPLSQLRLVSRIHIDPHVSDDSLVLTAGAAAVSLGGRAMSSPLTGDFDAVLEVSGATIDRLVASIHQNAFAKPNLPSFPHSAWIRRGDDYALDDVRGSLQVQISVPSIQLIDRASDRFGLSVAVRIRYEPDPSTQPLPTFINGTVRAEYEIADIDPRCPGWARIAPKYLWIRVLEDSVQFDGTTAGDLGGLGAAAAIHASDPALDAAQHEGITKQIAWLLATRFAAAPHPVSERFRRGALISLAPAGAGDSAIALPVATAGAPAGAVASITRLVLDGSDFAI